MRGSTLIDITGNTVGETEFQEIHPGQVAEETLVVGVPAYTYRCLLYTSSEPIIFHFLLLKEHFEIIPALQLT